MSLTLESQLHQFLTPRLGDFGFEGSGRLIFRRTLSSNDHLIIVGTRTDRSQLLFTCTVGLRFPSVESILRPDNPDETYPSVVCPIHLLRPEREYFEFAATTRTELRIAAASLVAEIADVGFKFFNRFSSLNEVFKELERAKVSSFFVLSPHQGIGTMAAIALSRGERATATELLTRAVKDAESYSTPRRRRVEELAARLLRPESGLEEGT